MYHIYGSFLNYSQWLSRKDRYPYGLACSKLYTRVSKDSNAAVRSVDSDRFYAVIHLSARSKTYINLYFLKQ